MNDERPIEKLLRGYAKKRREEAGAPLELHPATRRLLQGEVARQFPQAGAKGQGLLAEWLVVLRRRWLYATVAVSAVVVAAAVLWVLNQPERSETNRMELALARKQVAPAQAGQQNLVAEKREWIAFGQAMAPTSAVASEAKRSLNEATPAASAALAFHASQSDAEKLAEAKPDTGFYRALETEASAPAPAPPSRHATDGMALAQDRVVKKAPQPTATPEEYASTVNAAQQVSAETSVAKPVATLAGSTIVGVSQPEVSASPNLFSVSPDSSAMLDLTMATNTADSLGAGGRTRFAWATQAQPELRSLRISLDQDKAQVISQAFTMRAPTKPEKSAAKSAPASPVLTDFQIEQSGDQLRVIDGDGSVYLGALNTATGAVNGLRRDESLAANRARPAERPAAAPLAAAAPTASRPSAEKFFYRVAGTNRTLNQPVVFTWNFVPLTNAAAQSKTKAAGDALGKAASSLSQPFPRLLQNSTITGRAQINTAKEIEIHAVPVTR